MMKVMTVLYSDPVTAEQTLTVGYLIEREDHIVLLNDIIGEDGESMTRTVIPKSHIIIIENPGRVINLSFHKGGKYEGGRKK